MEDRSVVNHDDYCRHHTTTKPSPPPPTTPQQLPIFISSCSRFVLSNEPVIVALSHVSKSNVSASKMNRLPLQASLAQMGVKSDTQSKRQTKWGRPQFFSPSSFSLLFYPSIKFLFISSYWSPSFPPRLFKIFL